MFLKKVLFIIVMFQFLILGKLTYAGVHLGAAYLYNISSITEEGSTSEKLKHKGFGYEFEAGYAFGTGAFRIIPVLTLGVITLKKPSETEAELSAVENDTDYKMGRLSYGVRFDLGKTIFTRVGGAIYSLTPSPKPADNKHLNGGGFFGELGLSFNLIPFVSAVLAGRYEAPVYKKEKTSTRTRTLSNKVKQKNIAVFFSLATRI